MIRKEDVALEPTARGLRTGVYMGWDGDSSDALPRRARARDRSRHRPPPSIAIRGTRILFMVEGCGWTEVDGVRYDWKPWDAIHIPAWSWHRHGNDGDKPGALHELLVRADALDARHEPHRGRAATSPSPACRRARRSRAASPGDDPYARRLRRLATETKKRRSGRIHTPYDEQEILATPRGTRTKFLDDRAIGNEASGLTQVMIQFAPGKTQSLHRHPGEAWLYVVEGHGHSFMGTAPDKGEHHRWKKGDLIIVDHFLWHQHFNDDPKNQCRLVRVHMFDSILETMRALMDPMVLFEEAEDTLAVDAGALADPVARRQAAGRVMDRRAHRPAARACSRCTCCPPSTTTATGTPSSSRAR